MSDNSKALRDNNAEDHQNSNPVIDQPWTIDLNDAFEQLSSDPESGLSKKEAQKRLREHGPNRIEQKEKKSWWTILLNQFKSLVILILVAASIVSLAFGKVPEGIAVGVVVVINTIIGFITELRAVRSMEALQQMSRTRTRVLRSGDDDKVDSEKIVPGDILVFEAGDIIAADCRVVESAKMEVDESALTGESVPVAKTEDPVDPDTPLAERASMLYKGTALTSGSGRGLVVATGMNTELGQIARQVEEAEEHEKTPLESRIDALGKSFVWLTTGLAALIIVVGLVFNKDMLLLVESAIALAVAAVPEGLPIVATIALARGMHRMAKRNALINRLAAVETLGGASIITVDKTGTLTENRMTVKQIALDHGDIEVEGHGYDLKGEFSVDEEPVDPNEDKVLREALMVGALCVNADLNDDEGEPDPVGDPMEVALIVAAAKAGMRREDLLKEMPEQREVAFDREVKMMATYHESDDGLLIAIKGAPEAVLNSSTTIRTLDGDRELSNDDRKQWLDHSEEMADNGQRILALATRKAESAQEDETYKNLTFLGLAGLLDPPRENVRESIEASQRAGVRVIMATGDQAATARSIAYAVGLVEDKDALVVDGGTLSDGDQLSDEDKRRILDTNILARVSPKQKLTMIDLHQQQGNIVAMTGDGVNDAPALTKADIGIAMGQRGTQVAKDASDMILKDDAFSTIVAAIEHGRIIFRNIRKFVLFLLTISLTMIIIVFAGSLTPHMLPLLPLQVLFLNAVTHVLPALALGVGEGSHEVMKRPPLSADEPILTKRHWGFIVAHSFMIALVTMAAFYIAMYYLGYRGNQLVTVSFATTTLAQLLHVFNVRDPREHVIVNEITKNVWVWGAIGVSLVLTLVVIYVKPLADVMKLQGPGWQGWAVAAGCAVLFSVVAQVQKFIFGRKEREESDIDKRVHAARAPEQVKGDSPAEATGEAKKQDRKE